MERDWFVSWLKVKGNLRKEWFLRFLEIFRTERDYKIVWCFFCFILLKGGNWKEIGDNNKIECCWMFNVIFENCEIVLLYFYN